MSDPNSSPIDPDLLRRIVQSRLKQDKLMLAPQPFDADEATVQCLALLTDPESAVVPAEAFRELAKRNAALLGAPKSQIKAALARQVVVLEAAATRFMAKAAITSKPEHADVLMKISLSCNRALVSVLGALNSLAESEKDADAITV